MIELSAIDKTFNLGTIDEKVLFSNFNLTINDGEKFPDLLYLQE